MSLLRAIAQLIKRLRTHAPAAKRARTLRIATVARLTTQDGFTLVEVLAAATVMAIGTLGAISVFSTTERLSLVNERHMTMSQVAQREIERVEGLHFNQIALTSAPTSSSDSSSPDYYVVNGSPPALHWNRSTSSTESLVIDASNGTVQPVQSWNESAQGGTLSGQIYDFVSWTNDSQCSPGCPSTNDYKRIVVAVTMGNGIHPNPVYVTSVIADPQSAPSSGTVNGSAGNPLVDPTSTCVNSSGQSTRCTADLGTGTPNTYYLHDWSASAGTAQPPSADHPAHTTVGAAAGGTCTTSQLLAQISANTTGCPQPDLMDKTPPAFPAQGANSSCTTTSVFDYSTDLGSGVCGRELVPTCQGSACPSGSQPGTPCTGASCGGTGSQSDCSDGTWTNTVQNSTSELWVSPPLSANTTFTGAGGISFFTGTAGSAASGLVSLCVEIYDVPPSGSGAALTDIFAWPPTAIGGGAYIADSNGSGSNWPTAASQLAFVFSYSQQPATIPAGHRVGMRIWFKENASTPIQVIYDNPSYPAQLQLNSQ
jgi:prepilin-type N-terminal cleavage/methylation domain-containing protein